MTEVGNRKKKKKKQISFCSIKILTPGTLQRSNFFFFFFGLSIVVLSFRVLAFWMCLELQNSTQSHWKNKAQTSQGSPRVFLSSFLSFPSLLSCPLLLLNPSLAFSTLLCRVCVRSTAGGRWWSGVVTGWSSSSLYCSLDQYWDMSGSLPGTWTGTDTPGEMSPAEGRRREMSVKRNKHK